MTTSVLDDVVLASLQPRDLVVDIGSGSGAFSRAVLTAGGRVIAVDAFADACSGLATRTGFRFVHGAIGPAGIVSTYVPRLRRVLVTNARDGVAVPVVTLHDIVAAADVSALRVVRVRTAGQLSAAVAGLPGVLACPNGQSQVVLRLVGDAVLGDDATSILDALPGWFVTANTPIGLRTWTAAVAPLVPRLDWLLTTIPSDAPMPSDVDLVQLALVEGFAADPIRRTRVAIALRDRPALFANATIADLLDELALDPDQATWHAAGWWRSHLRTIDPRERSQRRARAHNRIIDRLAGARAN